MAPDENKEILQKLVGALENERRSIARDLHDELGQQLTAFRLKLDLSEMTMMTKSCVAKSMNYSKPLEKSMK